MNRRTIVVFCLLTVLAAATVADGHAAAKEKTKDCGDIYSYYIKKVRAKGVSCRVAKDVARHHWGPRYRGWRCKTVVKRKGLGSLRKIRCRKPVGKKVTFWSP